MKDDKDSVVGKPVKDLPPFVVFPADLVNGSAGRFFLQPNWFVLDAGSSMRECVADGDAWMTLVHDQFSLGVAQVRLDRRGSIVTDQTGTEFKADPAKVREALTRIERSGLIRVKSDAERGGNVDEVQVFLTYPHVFGESHAEEDVGEAAYQLWNAKDRDRWDLYPDILTGFEAEWE